MRTATRLSIALGAAALAALAAGAAAKPDAAKPAPVHVDPKPGAKPGPGAAKPDAGKPASKAPATPEQRTAALAALDAWVKAQNDGAFDAYAALYDAKFVGIKRTTDGGTQKYTLAKWKADRKKMFKVAQKVAADSPGVFAVGDTVTVEFVQRYQSGRYADHGDKELVLKAGAGGGLLIVREEMLYSAPGWDADPKAEVDATALVSPITTHVRQVASDPSRVGDCAGVTYTLELVDAKKKKQSIDVGSGVVMLDQAVVEIDHADADDKLYDFGQWCAGGGDYYQIIRAGDALVIRYKAEDEDTGDGEPSPPATFDTRLTVKLPPKAVVK